MNIHKFFGISSKYLVVKASSLRRGRKDLNTLKSKY
jgi:hypothetical protein